jgi:hypothetical protein
MLQWYVIMPILSPNRAPHNRPSKGTGTTRNHVFRELKNSLAQFEIVESNYWNEQAHNRDAALQKFIRMIHKSVVFTIDFLEDEVIVIPTRRGKDGMRDLRSLINKIQFPEMDESDDKLYLAMLKNFYEQFLEWSRTYKEEPPPGFVPMFNRGKVNLLTREKGRHRYGS